MLRRLLIAAVLLAGIGAFAAPHAHAATITCPDTQPNSVSSPHFYVSYQPDINNPDYANESQAQTVLSIAEQAYDKYVAEGYAAWASNWPDPTGQVEIDIVNLTSQNMSGMYCDGAFDLDAASLGKPLSTDTIYSTVFDEIAMSRGVQSYWILQGLGQWAAYNALGYPAESTTDVGPWDISLDCFPSWDASSGLELNACSKNPLENDRQTAWPFFEYLAERFGAPAFVNELMADVATANASSQPGLTGLQTALTAHGTSMDAEYGAFTAKLLGGGWTATVLNTIAQTVSGTIQTGAATGDTTPQSFRMGRLAARFVQIDRGDGDASHKCYSATLTINVSMAPTVPTQPVFYWPGTSPVPLTVSGSTATATVPWDTCKWSTHGYLLLQNKSSTLDNSYFTVSTHLVVSTTETTATAPPTPANGYGNATDVGSSVTPLSIVLRGPSTLKLSATDTTLDLVLQADNQGTISASLGALFLGTKTVVPGMNAIHFSIPAGSTGTLTVTPTASDGVTLGKPVTLAVTKVAATNTNSKLKHTVKKKPKLKFAAKTAKKPKK